MTTPTAFDTTRCRIYLTEDVDVLNKIVNALKSGKHGFAESECARVWGMLTHRARQLGFTQLGDRTFRKPLQT